EAAFATGDRLFVAAGDIGRRAAGVAKRGGNGGGGVARNRAGRRLADLHQRRAAVEGLPFLGIGVWRDGVHAEGVAGVFGGRSGAGAGGVSTSGTTLWRAGTTKRLARLLRMYVKI